MKKAGKSVVTMSLATRRLRGFIARSAPASRGWVLTTRRCTHRWRATRSPRAWQAPTADGASGESVSTASLATL